MGFIRINAAPIMVALIGLALLTTALAIVDPVIGSVFGLIVLVASIGVHRIWRGRFDLTARYKVSHVVLSGLVALLGVLVVIQLVPYGRDHSNPSVTQEPAWDSPRTRELAIVACYDCHSNEVVWPWYSDIAPFSWSVQRHVDEGREELNFSEWDRNQEGDEAAESVQEGEMPPLYYTLTHPAARLSDADKSEIITGFINTFGR
jgi:hypothetical protein